MFLTFLHNAIRFSTVFLFGSTGETLTEKSGHLNLGIPGIMCFGAVGGCIGESMYLASLKSTADINGFLAIFIPIIFALLFGALLGALYSFFTVTLHCNQNVTGLTITTFGVGFNSFYMAEIDLTGMTAAASYFNKGIMPLGQNWFGDIFLSYGILVYIAVFVSIIIAIVIKNTRTGLYLTAVGENPATADAVGVNVAKYRYVSTILGSAIAALGGVFFIMDYLGGAIEYSIDSFGWMAVALVIFTIWRADLGIIGAIVFGALYIAPNYLGLSFSGMQLFKLVPYLVTLIILIITSLINKRETQPPTALGVNYFREDR